MMLARDRFILRETCIGAVLNGLLSYGIFRLTFGGAPTVMVHGLGNFLTDFVPQGFMVALMSAFVPGLFATRAIAQGHFPGGTGEFAFLPRALLLKAFVLALAAVIFPALPVIGLLAIVCGDSIDWASASVLKIAFGSGVSVLITPISLRSILPTP